MLGFFNISFLGCVAHADVRACVFRFKPNQRRERGRWVRGRAEERDEEGRLEF